MSTNRVEYFDFLRGIAILFVVAIHSFTPFLISESNTLSYHLAIIWRLELLTLLGQKVKHKKLTFVKV